MSSRFETSAVRRSVSSSIVSRNASSSCGDHSMSCWRKLDADALIDASGVRRSCDTACRSAVRNSLASVSCGRVRGRLREPRAITRRGELRRERVEHLPIGAGEPAAHEREHDPIAERQREVGRPRETRAASNRPTLRPATRRRRSPDRAGEHARAVEPERRAHEHDEIGERIVVLHVGREPGQRLGIGARPRRVASPARRRVDERC